MRSITRDIVGALIVSGDGKILFGKTDPKAGGVYQGCWVIPGGGIEQGETQLQAVRREVREETGLDITPFETELVNSANKGKSEKTLKETGERVLVHMNFFDFVVNIPLSTDKIGVHPTEELVELCWLSAHQLTSANLSPPIVKLLKKVGYL
jgi:8-oxo-dGTP pyrophosphatase MutT (NUDIX family)